MRRPHPVTDMFPKVMIGYFHQILCKCTDDFCIGGDIQLFANRIQAVRKCYDSKVIERVTKTQVIVT